MFVCVFKKCVFLGLVTSVWKTLESTRRKDYARLCNRPHLRQGSESSVSRVLKVRVRATSYGFSDTCMQLSTTLPNKKEVTFSVSRSLQMISIIQSAAPCWMFAYQKPGKNSRNQVKRAQPGIFRILGPATIYFYQNPHSLVSGGPAGN